MPSMLRLHYRTNNGQYTTERSSNYIQSYSSSFAILKTVLHVFYKHNFAVSEITSTYIPAYP